MGIFDFFKDKDYNKKNKKLDFDFDALVITAYLLKEIAEIDGEFADSEKNFLIDFLNINNIAEKYDCSSYEINRILNYYKKDNVIIEILKKISSTRNKYIVYHFNFYNFLWL